MNTLRQLTGAPGIEIAKVRERMPEFLTAARRGEQAEVPLAPLRRDEGSDDRGAMLQLCHATMRVAI
jgi:hypothetical protein